MKIQIDTSLKTIKLDSTVKFSELLEVLGKMFPNEEWKEFKLETNTVINNWSTPIVIERYRPWVSPFWSYTNGGGVTLGGSTDKGFKIHREIPTNECKTTGIYNVETKF